MEEKINIAELLKDCPTGMELDCAMYDDCKFLDVDTVSDTYLIRINTPCGIKYLDKHGCYSINPKSKCVIFPKGKTTWEGFIPPCKFKDGDVITSLNTSIYIFTEHNGYFFSPCGLIANHEGKNHYFKVCDISISPDNMRLATEEEKQKLFDAIKDNGYKWNEETKTLEKLIEPKFKVGDKIKYRLSGVVYKVSSVLSNGYEVRDVAGTNEIVGNIDIEVQDDWELALDKFDISTLVPFESRVLVRCADGDLWIPAIFGFLYSRRCYVVGGLYWKQCIPYEVNKELLGTTNDCDEYYKTW